MSLIRGLISKLKLILIFLLLIPSALAIMLFFSTKPENGIANPIKPYVGVAFCGNTTAEAKQLIDKIKEYTNLFVLQSGPISKNETAINMICDYAVDSGLDFIVYFGWFDFEHPWQIPWLDFAKDRWGDSFLGVYLYDEPGGIQIDYDWTYLFQRIKEFYPSFFESIAQYIRGDVNRTVIRDYEEATKRHIEYIVNDLQINQLIDRSITAFTADYALYWFDYLAGYDTIFVELGWNHSTPKHIGMCRGAANVQRKDWGAIIVWNALDPETDKKGVYKTGEEMLQDMIVAYETGAKYVVIFNYPTNPPGNPYGILTEEHFAALEQFWAHIQQNPEEYGRTEGQVALVLPKNYGWGMRHPEDEIWGYWGPDEISPQIWELSQYLLDQYGLALDIVYDDPDFPIADIYQEIYYWNHTG